jgi:hypothetical protein
VLLRGHLGLTTGDHWAPLWAPRCGPTVAQVRQAWRCRRRAAGAADAQLNRERSIAGVSTPSVVVFCARRNHAYRQLCRG